MKLFIILLLYIYISPINGTLPNTPHYPTTYTQFEVDMKKGTPETEVDYTQKPAYLGNSVSVLDFPPGYFGMGGGFSHGRKFKHVNPFITPGNVMNLNPYTPVNVPVEGVFETPEPPGWKVPKEASNEKEDPFNGLRARQIFPSYHKKLNHQNGCIGCQYI